MYPTSQARVFIPPGRYETGGMKTLACEVRMYHVQSYKRSEVLNWINVPYNNQADLNS